MSENYRFVVDGTRITAKTNISASYNALFAEAITPSDVMGIDRTNVPHIVVEPAFHTPSTLDKMWAHLLALRTRVYAYWDDGAALATNVARTPDYIDGVFTPNIDFVRKHTDQDPLPCLHVLGEAYATRAREEKGDREDMVFLYGQVSPVYPWRQAAVDAFESCMEALPLTFARAPCPNYTKRLRTDPDLICRYLRKSKIALTDGSRFGLPTAKHIECASQGCMVLTDAVTAEVVKNAYGIECAAYRQDNVVAEVKRQLRNYPCVAEQRANNIKVCFERHTLQARVAEMNRLLW